MLTTSIVVPEEREAEEARAKISRLARKRGMPAALRLGRPFVRAFGIYSLLLALVASCIYGQSGRGTITGTITDATGAVVANAPVEVKNLDTGAQYSAAGTTTGNYTISELPVGTYQLSVTVPGFKKFVRGGLQIAAAQTYRIDVALEVGTENQSVTVTAEVSLLKTESGDLGHDIANKSLDELPVLGIGSSSASNAGVRNPLAMTELLPGAQFAGDTTVVVNGAPNNTESFRIDGQDSSNSMNTTLQSQVQPSVDSIQEVQVETSNYAAEYGRAGGGVFIATSKSGTNSFHGTAYDYFVNEALNASTPFVNVKPRNRRNDFGGTFGGPVVLPKLYDGHNKTFFFYNFEAFRETTVTNNTPDTVPTLAYRQGNFASALTGQTLGTDPLGRPILQGEIYDPASNFTAPNGQIVRNQFPNNAIPASRMDPVALAIQNLIPLPSGPSGTGLINNYLPSYSASRHTDINSIKVDHSLTDNSKLSIYFDRTETHSPLALFGDGLPETITGAIGNNVWTYTTRVNYDYTITPTTLLHIGLGYQNQHGPAGYTASDNFNPASIGLTGVLDTGRFPNITGLLSTIGTGGMQNMGAIVSDGAPGCVTCGGLYLFRPSGNASVTWIRGNHTYKAGTEVIFNNYMNQQDYPGSGNFVFSPGETSLPYLYPNTTLNGGTPGFAYASFLLGAVDSGNVGLPTDPHMVNKSVAFFIQDSWKVTSKLTLDYGLRYDYQTYNRESYGRMPSFSATVLNSNAGNLPGGTIYESASSCNCNFGKNYPFAFGPRLGVAYQLAPKTVFRAGFGVVYAATPAFDNYTITSPNPFQSPGGFTPAMYLQNGVNIPLNPWPDFSASQFPNVPGQIGSAPSLVDPNAGRPARQLQWSVGLQQEITPDLLVDVTYVGNRGAWWPANGFADYNALTPQVLAAHGLSLSNPTDIQLLEDTISNPAVVAAGFKAPYASFPANATLAQALRPFPQFGNITGMYAPLGDTWYDALQVKVTKRLSHGLMASYSLAWQKSLTMGAFSEGTGSGTTTGGLINPINDAFNREVNKDISQYDQPLVSIISVSYTTPKWTPNFGAASKPISWLARDWTLGALLTYRSGLPIEAPVATNNLSSLLFQNTFVNAVPGVNPFLVNLNCNCYDPNKTLVLNPAAWSQPAAGQFGNAAAYYSDYRQERHPSENMNFGRTFRLTERANLNIRAEFTNIFNRTFIPAPASTNIAAPVLRSNGIYTGGFGYINTATAGTQAQLSQSTAPRQGMIVARITF